MHMRRCRRSSAIDDSLSEEVFVGRIRTASRRGVYVCGALMVVWATVSTPTTGQSARSDELDPLRRTTDYFLTVFQNLDWDAFRAIWSDNPSVFFPFQDTPERV